MKYILKISILTLIIIIFSCAEKKDKPNTISEVQFVDDYSAKIDSLIETTSPRKFNGVILITQNGKIRYSKEYGYSDFEKKIPISLNDNFRIQSNSKQITAVLILKEVEKGNINLQNPIREYLPDLAQPWADTVTVHQLLNMSSGIVDVEKPLIFEPGTDFMYSNAAYSMLGSIIKNVTGNEYVEMANTLFKELGMYRTYCYELGMSNNEQINGYIHNSPYTEFNQVYIDKTTALRENPEEWYKDIIPVAGTISNLNDLSIWDKALHNGQLLKPETYRLMVNKDDRTTDFFKAYGKEKVGYGYGVIISKKPTVNIGHPGTGFGFTSLKIYFPESDLNVIVLENLYDDNNREVNIHFEKEIRKIVMNSNLTKQ